jgi:hypothetical protein
MSKEQFCKAVLGSCLAVGLLSATAAAQRIPKDRLDAPTITCVGTSQATIQVQVCAGPSGATAGFSLQWTRLPDGVSCEDFQWQMTADVCKASFSGVPRCSAYTLAPAGMPHDCVVVEIGNLNDAECGVGFNTCGGEELQCGTAYVIRAFAHAQPGPDGLKRSAFTANLCCTTQECGGCVRSQGYWRTHPCDWPPPFQPGANGSATGSGQCALTSNPNQQCLADPNTTMTIAGIGYTMGQLLCVLARPGMGNALVNLGHQLVAAKLNALNGASVPQDVQDAMDCAETLIASATNPNLLTGVVPSGGQGNTLGPAMNAKANFLGNYNTGFGGVPHCEDDE